MKLRRLITLATLAAAFTLRADIPALTPVPQTGSWAGWWMPQFESIRSLAATGGCEIAFLGDSVTRFFQYGRGKSAWRKYFASGRYRALDAGIGGDRTENVLWRLDHGQFDGMDAKAVCLMIGINNICGRSVDKEPPIDTILGVKAILDRLAVKLPKAKVVLLPVFPVMGTADDQRRRRIDVVNRELSKFADGRRVIWLDFTDRLVAPDGRLFRESAGDYVHPEPWTYEVWANEIIPVFDQILEGREFIASKYGRVNPSVLSDRPFRTTRPASRIPDAWWVDRIRANRNAIAASGGEIDAVFLGDSITHYWDEGEGQDTSTEITDMRRKYSILNCGYGGDTVQHLRWRIEYGGELDGFRTKFIMLMIGTNNAGGDLPDEIAYGIRELIDLIRAKQPQAKILNLAIFPRGEKPDEDRFTRCNRVVNAILKEYSISYFRSGDVFFKDINHIFLRPDGTLRSELFDFEFLHPIDGGFTLWRREIEPIMKDWIGR